MNNTGPVIVLAMVFIALCLVSKNYKEGFGNIKKINPQGSWRSPNTFNPGPSVENWKINNGLFEPGTKTSLNFTSVKDSFPYYKFMPERYEDNDIGLIKSDGVVVGGYMPQIIRPFDNVTANPSKDSECNWPCFSDKKHQKWCSEKNAMEYHAMRPIVSSEEYNNMLRNMFKIIVDKNGVSGKIPENDKFEQINTAVFCTESQQAIMNWLMQKIASAVEKMPSMQRNGSWKSERFYETDVNMYQYVTDSGNTYFKLIFNLYNPLRSVASLVVATVYLVNGDPTLVDIAFVNDEKMESFMPPENGFGSISGENIKGFSDMDIDLPENLGFKNGPEGRKDYVENYKKDPNQFNWNYKNTLEEQKFNKYGFYSNVPEDNINIDGGIPAKLKKAMYDNSCSAEQLMSCVVPKFNGIMGVSAKSLNNGMDKPKDKFSKVSGELKNVYNNPSLVYKQDNPISVRGVETVNGTVFI